MNNIETGKARQSQANRPPSRNSNQRKTSNLKVNQNQRKPIQPPRKKKRATIIPLVKIFLLAVIGVVIISLIIMSAKNFFNPKDTQIGETSSEVSSSVLPESDDLVNLGGDISAGRPEDKIRVIPTPAPELDITDLPVYQYGSMATVGNVGYEYYKFDLTMADKFINTVNTSVSKINTDTNIYSMIVPSAVDIMLPLSFLEENSSLTSDQEKTIAYINSKFNQNIRNINLYPILKAYSNQKLYFNTDNRITSLAGYYIYEELCYATGARVIDLNQYQKSSVSGFWGNIGTFIGSDQVADKELIEYYVPSSKITMGDGESMFVDVTDSSPSAKYNVFLGESKAETILKNASLNDGSTAVIIGDSMAKTIVPFVAQNYENLYFLDYRYFENSLADYIADKKPDDLIYCFNITATNTQNLIEKID